ncbi:MAG: lamin tail domain-containing protein, partial [Acidobacteriota bacterium]|nr:lamin tail domain-containing protein [Acidobacteriota bacterium]
MSFSRRRRNTVFLRRRKFLAVAAASLLIFPLLALIVPTTQAISTTVVISQFQVAGGTAADEFVELHNVGTSDFNLNGHRVVYRSAAGTSDVAVINWTADTIIPPGGYYLIAQPTGYDGTVTPDITFNAGGSTGTFSGASGGLALRNGAANTGTIVDSVGYGTATNAFVETATTTVPAANDSKARKSSGCTDTDNNANDFELVSPSAPRNSSSSMVVCGGGGGGGTTLSINDVTVAEGNSGATVATFTVSLSQPAGAGGVTFDIATQDYTATEADNDYEPQTLTGQTIIQGSQTYTFSVTVNGDTKTELNESFFVNVTNVIG